MTSRYVALAFSRRMWHARSANSNVNSSTGSDYDGPILGRTGPPNTHRHLSALVRPPPPRLAGTRPDGDRCSTNYQARDGDSIRAAIYGGTIERYVRGDALGVMMTGLAVKRIMINGRVAW
jgi:hypothetical protein